jgi:hypothetical protein
MTQDTRTPVHEMRVEQLGWTCGRAMTRRDCPFGHDWVGDDFAVAYHRSEETHRAALAWAKAQDEEEHRFDTIEGVTPPQPWQMDGYASREEAGIHGYGRCGRCGESFRHNDEMAEVAGDHDDPSGRLLDNLVIHVSCIAETDVLA